MREKRNFYVSGLIAFCVTMMILFVNIVINNGRFVYGGDYAYQQIPFYSYAADVVKNGQTGWDWYTDLGTDFIGSYSFYVLGSVFFWICAALPQTLIIYAMPVFIALKTSVAALTSYVYIKRYVNDPDCVLIGSLLYAFSGFQLFNIVFNHFHDVTALFPLLLLSFDLIVTENRRFLFAFMTAVMAYTNYFFFIGQIVFILIYYFIRCIKKDFKFNAKSLLAVSFEAVLGIAIASVLLLPSFFAVSSLGRVSGGLYGTNLISYADNTIVPKILQSIFTIPDPPGYAQLFKSEYNPDNWASVSLYIPFFSIAGVYTYIKNNRTSFISVLLLVCLFFSVVPVLNSAFYFFRSSYYARWFYMPVLFMAISTSKTIEEQYDIKPGIKFSGIGVLILCIISLLPGEDKDIFYENSNADVKWFHMSQMPVVFWQNTVLVIIALMLLWAYNEKYKNERKSVCKLAVTLVAFITVTGSVYINNSADNLRKEDYYNRTLSFVPEIESDSFYRTGALNEGLINCNLFWKKGSVNQFHSIVTSQSEDLYRQVKSDNRGMYSKYDEEDYPIYGLLSVKYIFNESTGDDLNVQKIPAEINGFELYDKQGCYYIFENQNFVPPGFCYDYYITDEQLNSYIENIEGLSEKSRQEYKQLIMMRAAVIKEDDVSKYSAYISPVPNDMLENLDSDSYYADCRERARYSCSYFEYDSRGFKAQIDVDSPKLLFFSIPSACGWSAELNGEHIDIDSINYGFIGVPVTSGLNEIVCSYETPGLRTGTTITIISVCLFILYIMVYSVIRKRIK